jgi:Tol biopolymer transport system component
MFIIFLPTVFENPNNHKAMLVLSKWFIIFMFFVLNINIYAQYLDLSDGQNITNMKGDELCAEWSYDGKKLLFQSEINGITTLLIYQIDSDTIVCLGDSSSSYYNPVWHPNGTSIVFDSDAAGSNYLYQLDLANMKVKPLFNRKIASKDASFSNSSRQVYFTGFNELTNTWELYNYDFIYDNLNKLTNCKLGVSDCDVSSNGKLIVYHKDNPFTSSGNLEIVNWYGEKLITFDDYNGKDASWDIAGFKLFFISEMNKGNSELYSVWKDGEHLERITEIKEDVANPVVSPDGSMLAMSVKTKNGWDVYIFPFDDY